MRPALTKITAVSLAALLAGATVTAEAAGRGGAWHGGGWHGGGWHGGGWGWGPAVVGGLGAGALLGGVLAAPYAYGYGGCFQYRPVYSANGVYLGTQLVNVCP